MELCIECNENPIWVKKRQLCSVCYQRQYRNKRLKNKSSGGSYKTIKKHEHTGEINFVKNFFKHNNWMHHPCMFHLNGIKYTPDFYDGERNVFIEVSTTRQAYHANKEKYELMERIFPKINFEIRTPDGDLLDEKPNREKWFYQYNK